MTQHRGGDASITIDGEAKTLRLTLGALAAIEETLGEGDFATLQKKLEAPRVADLLVILKALLQGGGTLLSLDALKASDIDLSDAASAIARAFRALAPQEAPSVTLRVTAPPQAGEQGHLSPPPPRAEWRESNICAPSRSGEVSAKPTEGGRS